MTARQRAVIGTALAPHRTTGDLALLAEAVQKYPHDPKAAFEGAIKKDALPEDRRQWLDAFKQSAPENALANYLSALRQQIRRRRGG